MVQKELENTSKLTYDDRRKVLLQKKSNVTENRTDEIKTSSEGNEVTEKSKLVSTVKSIMEVEYSTEGIKIAYKGLNQEKQYHDKHLVDLRNGLKEAGEMTPELQKLKDDLQKIAKIDKAEKSKNEIVAVEERLKIVNKELKDIKDEIGTRLKL
jgi:hypothetical protein